MDTAFAIGWYTSHDPWVDIADNNDMTGYKWRGSKLPLAHWAEI